METIYNSAPQIMLSKAFCQNAMSSENLLLQKQLIIPLESAVDPSFYEISVDELEKNLKFYKSTSVHFPSISYRDNIHTCGQVLY